MDGIQQWVVGLLLILAATGAGLAAGIASGSRLTITVGVLVGAVVGVMASLYVGRVANSSRERQLEEDAARRRLRLAESQLAEQVAQERRKEALLIFQELIRRGLLDALPDSFAQDALRKLIDGLTDTGSSKGERPAKPHEGDVSAESHEAEVAQESNEAERLPIPAEFEELLKLSLHKDLDTTDKLIRQELELNQTEHWLALPALWEVTHSRLDLYHQIATRQARQSFMTAQAAIGIGFALLVIFAVLAARSHTTASAITTATLGAVSAALAGYIGRTFVRSQESAADRLRAYFDQPLEFSKYLAAERLLASAGYLDGNQRSSILTALVEAIVGRTAPAKKKSS